MRPKNCSIHSEFIIPTALMLVLMSQSLGASPNPLGFGVVLVVPTLAMQPAAPEESEEADEPPHVDPAPNTNAPVEPIHPEPVPALSEDDHDEVLADDPPEQPAGVVNPEDRIPSPEPPPVTTRPNTPSRGAEARPNRGPSRPETGRSRSSRSSRTDAPRAANSPPSADERRATGSAGRRDFSAFRIITDRNIFNASRSPRATRPPEPSRSSRRADTLTLVGTLSYEKGPYAFFDGSSSEFKKVLETGQSIAGYRVTQITANAVQLDAGTNKVELRVGMQMRREEGDWRVVDDGGKASAADTSSGSESSDSSTEESDIVKRMMQQRERDLQ